MLTTAQTAKLLGITPGRVRQLLTARDSDTFDKLSDTEKLQVIPLPIHTSPQMFSEWEVLRTRAYREGGDVARRVELAAWTVFLSDRAEAVRLLELLHYPSHDPAFVEWAMTEINTEVSGDQK